MQKILICTESVALFYPSFYLQRHSRDVLNQALSPIFLRTVQRSFNKLCARRRERLGTRLLNLCMWHNIYIQLYINTWQQGNEQLPWPSHANSMEFHTRQKLARWALLRVKLLIQT